MKKLQYIQPKTAVELFHMESIMIPQSPGLTPGYDPQSSAPKKQDTKLF